MTAFTLRVLVLLAAALLAACAGPSSEESLSAAASAEPAAAPVSGRPTYQGRGMVAAPPPPPVAQEPALTIEHARGECWMQVDRDKKTARDLDKRVKLVEACVEKKMSAAPPQ
jgi:ABC-type Fe3+-hydroxamate transport system substrate-binding protein